MNLVPKRLLLCVVWCSALLSCAAPDALIITDPIFSTMGSIEGVSVPQLLTRELEENDLSVALFESSIPIGTAFYPEKFEELIRRIEQEDPKTVIVSPLITALIVESLSQTAYPEPGNLIDSGKRRWVFWNIPGQSIQHFSEIFPQMINIRPKVLKCGKR